jgi:light-regulated signal transduction histidine kinase (bacteriophytochrome)
MTFTDKPKGLQQSLDQESLLHQMINQIRRSLDLQEILTTTVSQVRLFLGADRVKVYRFDTDGSGEVIAESIHTVCHPYWDSASLLMIFPKKLGRCFC